MPLPSYYVTTPIYYVNDRPHIGHCYSTLVADALARLNRLILGDPSRVFFLTGTDEHAEKVVVSARERGVTPLEWADRNAAEFEKAFALMNFSNDDFMRTTQERHKAKVAEYIRRLIKTGDVYLGDFEGWFDKSQEEYLTETVAKESPHGPYTSPVTGVPLEKRTEKNYFFRLSKFQGWLKSHIEAHPEFVMPEARRNEVLGRLRDGLQDIPISRAVTGSEESRWGILMPDDPSHRIYVWIDALFNYLSVVDTPARRQFWPAQVHVMAKDILWFHAVIWPCLLNALGEPLPRTIYAHSFYVREGRKMSKSLGNFIDIDVIRAYCDRYSVDAMRWYLLTQGPLGATDADFAHGKFVEVYNADLANGLGNCASRVGNMIEKYFGGVLPEAGWGATHGSYDFKSLCQLATTKAIEGAGKVDLGAVFAAAVRLIGDVDGYINVTAPFKLAKTVEANPAAKGELASILCNCAEAIRVSSLLFSAAIPAKAAALWTAWGCAPQAGVPLAELAAFGGKHALKTGQKISKGDPLFMRADPAEAAPVASV